MSLVQTVQRTWSLSHDRWSCLLCIQRYSRVQSNCVLSCEEERARAAFAARQTIRQEEEAFLLASVTSSFRLVVLANVRPIVQPSVRCFVRPSAVLHPSIRPVLQPSDRSSVGSVVPLLQNRFGSFGLYFGGSLSLWLLGLWVLGLWV